MSENKEDVLIFCNNENPKKLTTSLIIIIASTIFSIFLPVGYNIGVINAPAEHIKNWIQESLISRYNVQLLESDLELLWAFIVSIYLIGAAIASLGGSWIANKFGRKPGILASAIFFILSAIFYVSCRAASSMEMLIVGRLLSGFGAGLSTAIGSMYLAEVAPLSLRGPAATCISLGITGGVFIGQIFSIDELLGSKDLWEYGLSVYSLFVIISLAPILWFPESPKFLYIVMKDREKARDALRKLRGPQLKFIEEDMVMMEKEATESDETKSIFAVLKDSTLLLPLLLVLLIPFAMQLSGLNAVFFYSVSIFETAGLNAKDAQWATLIVGGINLMIIAMSPYMMASVNRRPLLLFSTLFSIIFLILFAVIVHFIDYAEWLSIASIFAMVGFIASIQIGLGPIAFFIGSELFESSSRPAAMALGSLSSWLGNTIVGMIFPIMQLTWGSFAFLPLAAILLIFLIFLIPYMPETRGRPTAEVANLLSNGLRSRPLRK